MTNRQIKLVENYIRKVVRKSLIEQSNKIKDLAEIIDLFCKKKWQEAHQSFNV